MPGILIRPECDSHKTLRERSTARRFLLVQIQFLTNIRADFHFHQICLHIPSVYDKSHHEVHTGLPKGNQHILFATVTEMTGKYFGFEQHTNKRGKGTATCL